MKESVGLEIRIIDKLCEIQNYINKKRLYYQKPIDINKYIKDLCGDLNTRRVIYIDTTKCNAN